jgi:polyferredoxin
VNEPLPYQLLADVVLALHVAILVFVVGGLAFIIVGNLRAWRGANALWFRAAHLAAIAVVVAEAWFGSICPLTSLEMWLRAKAGATTYAGSFIEYWLQRILYYEAPAWVFALGYSLFGLVVLATWWYFPPRFGRRAHDHVSDA